MKRTKGEAPEMMTVEEVAAFLRLGRSATYAAVQRGEIPSIRIGRKLRISRTALKRHLTQVDE